MVHQDRTLAHQSVRAERLPGVVALQRFVDDRDVPGANVLADAEAAVLCQDRRPVRIGLGSVAEGFVGQSLGQRVVDDQREAPGRMSRGVGKVTGQPRGGLGPFQEQLDRRDVVVQPW